VSDTELLCERVDIVPLEVVVRDRVAGSLAKRYGLDEGAALSEPLVELFYKSDPLGDPLITDDAAVILGYARRWEIAFLKETALRVHGVLRTFWKGLGIDLVDAKYEFGRKDGALLLADELTPDGARLWDVKTGQKLDKDVFRRDLGDLGETYRALAARVFGH
jgi:phosphoribosylaminoimidazole-succinocarboxamide synthase